MPDMSTGECHPPPQNPKSSFGRGRIIRAIRDAAGIPPPLAWATGLAEVDMDTPIESSKLGLVQEVIRERTGRDVPAIRKTSPEGSQWTLGSLATYLEEVLNSPQQ
jgi:hypothetical protein